MKLPVLKLRIKNLNGYVKELNREIDLLAKRKEKITVINAGIESQYSLIDRLRSWKPGDSIMSETEQNQLPDLMDKECNDFATKLRIRYPALKSHDILICCLIKLRISNEYIASLTCCKYESVLTKRFRIKQRMNRKGGEPGINYQSHLVNKSFLTILDLCLNDIK